MQRYVGEECLGKDQAASAFLREYRSTPHSTTGRTPAELMLGRQFGTRLPHVEKKQQLAKPVRPAKFSNGNHVFIRNYGLTRRVNWIPGRVTSSVGTRMFNVQCADGSIVVMSIRCARVFAATSRRVPFSGSYAIGYTNTWFTKMRDADKGRPTRCSQCRMQCFAAAHAIAIRRTRTPPNSELWGRNVVFSFRLNPFAPTRFCKTCAVSSGILPRFRKIGDMPHIPCQHPKYSIIIIAS